MPSWPLFPSHDSVSHSLLLFFSPFKNHTCQVQFIWLYVYTNVLFLYSLLTYVVAYDSNDTIHVV